MNSIFKIFVLLPISLTVCYKLTAISSKKWVKPHSPYYDASRNRLLFVDLVNGTVINYDLAKNTIHEVIISGIITPGFVIPVEGSIDQFIIGNHLSTTKIKWNGVDPVASIVQQQVFAVEASPALAYNNYLVGKASPDCQFYGGTYRTEMCSNTPLTRAGIYRYNKCTGVKNMASGYKVTGGFDWNAAGNKFYYVDSCNRVIIENDYDGRTGKISNGRIVYTSTEGYGYPATVLLGMTTDTDGFLYVAVYGGGVVLKIDPIKGIVVLAIHFPAEVIGSLTWGGANLDILFVATYSSVRNIFTGETNTTEKLSPESGKVFMVTDLNAKGVSGRPACV